MSEFRQVGAKWDDFVEKALPKDLPDYIIRVLRIAFYSGAKATQNLMFDIVSPGEVRNPTDHEIARVKDILTELDEFILEKIKEKGGLN